MKTQDLKERFLRRCPAPNDRGCIEWSGHRNKKRGYGRIQVEGKPIEAHRMAWRILVGEIPQGLHVPLRDPASFRGAA